MGCALQASRAFSRATISESVSAPSDLHKSESHQAFRYLGHHERVPYNGGSMRSVYHTREYAIRRLSLVRGAAVQALDLS
jgi:hypothetical protein